MSFGFGGGGGFGQNTQNQSSNFGGFGANNTSTPSGFGGTTGTSAFGAGANTGTTGTGMFGGGATGGTGGAFGASTTSGFGGTGGFGSKPAFGTPATTSAGGGLFGSGATTTTAGGTGFGGAGFGGANTTTSTPFGGGGNTSLFGGAKPATTGFGAGTSTFGTGGATGGGGLFGSGTGAGTTGFGATTNPGIGTNIGDPPGTAIVPFSPTVEKEPNNPSQSNSFQNLLFMDAYRKWSADELRLTDYNQGRKTGGTGGTGAFGGSNFGGTTGFGSNTGSAGFGANTGTGMFGSTQPAATGFGATNNTTTGGFGAGAGGLFGSKPATGGGMFGSTATTQPAQTGGIFGGGGAGAFGGGAATTNTGFGANTGNTGGGLFGTTNTAAAKPAGFSFGTTATNTGGGGFGGATATPGFGQNTTAANTGGGGLFGNTAQANAGGGGGGLFGQQQQQQQPANTGFGGGGGFGAQPQNAGGGLFGNQQQQQQKPGGLFGGSTANTGATGGLFGNTNTGATSGFGGATAAQPAAGGLFGNKPAGTGGGLFGNTTAQTGATGGGLFGNLGGNTQTQQPAQNSLFGGLGQSTQAKPSLFGNTAPAGGGLFGNQPAQQQQGGMFGASNNQQQPQQGMLGNSLLGNSQGQQMPQQAFNASIHDMSAYGAATLFSGLPEDKIQNPGPLATPLSGASKVKSRSILPMYKLSPANASRLATPQKRGYGFSYSAYGSPASPSSVSSTPGGFSQSLLAGNINRNLSKSISASNLRRSFNVEDSILQPGAFSANSSMRLLGSAGNHKKLVINKEMRSDLFTSPNKEKQVPEDASGSRKLAKRVSFDTSTVETTPETRPAALENGSSTDDQGHPKPNTSARPSTNGVNAAKSSPTTAAPETEQVKGNELAIVPEEESPAAVRTEKKLGSTIEPGSYWMSPTIEEIRAMNRVQRQRIPDFTVGRENVGSVSFKIPVDLSNINLDELFDGIVILVPRSATVYPVAAKKPPVGKGLNVPAVISLEHSYPRGGPATSGRRLERHIERLKTAIPDTTFESYDKETGVWTFSVEHFTTYGLGDDDDEDEETEIETIQARRAILSPSIVKDSTSPSDPDDTFEFRRSRRAFPGAFDDAALSDNEEAADAAQRQGTLSPEPQEADAPLPSREWPEDESMADGPDDYQLEAFEQSSQQGSVDGQDDLYSRYADNEAQVPAGIMRARLRAFKKSTAPTRIEVAGGDDWTQILQASVRAPRTVDRATLRALNESGAVWDIKDRGSPAPQRNAPAPDGAGFATSIDLMKSLFEQAKGPAQPAQASPTKGFVKWPYQQRPKVDQEEGPSVPRTNWGPNELLVTTHHGEPSLQPVDGSLPAADSSAGSPETLARLQHYIDNISGKEGQPVAGPEFRDLAMGDSSWELASLLFDDNGYSLPVFWRQLVSDTTDRALARESGLEEKAIICLAGNRVADACGHLLAAGNYRLATLVSSIGMQNKDMKAQLKDWRESNVLAEFSKPIRAIYELLAGNACVCSGVKNAPIENRVDSFTISQRFGLDWMRSFGLRLFYTTGTAPNVAEAVRSFQADIEQDKEPEPDSALWSLLKAFANQDFDWSDTRLGWLMTKAIYATGKVSFGQDAAEKLDMASLSFASSLTVQSHWVQATFVLLQLSDAASRESAVRDHLGRHAHRIGSPRNPTGAFSALRKFGVPEAWIWEAKALDFRTRGDSQQEFVALVWAQNYAEANQAFVHRVGPDLVIARDFHRLFRFAQLLFKVKGKLQDWDRAAAVYLLYPMARQQNRQQKLDKFDHQLFDGLVALRGQTHGDIRQEAAIGDMAEELIRCRGGDPRLFGLLPGDIRGKYMRTQALENIC